jgi:integrase
MPRPKSLKPAHCHHKASGRAFVTLDGRRIYLGAHGSQASRDGYDTAIASWISRGRRPAVNGTAADGHAPPSSPTVTMIVQAFWSHAKTYYVHPDGAATSEQTTLRYALRHLKRMFGASPAADFGPMKLKAVREAMLQPTTHTDPKTGKPTTRAGWARSYVNRQVARLKLMFKWAVSMEMVPAPVYQALATVPGLKRGRTEARETKPIRPVAQADVDAVLPHLSRQVAAMVQTQLLTGARPGEVCAMTTAAIDRTQPVWVYRPTQHKTLHHDHVREIRIGPKAQAIVTPFLKLALPDAPIFSPAEAEAQRRAKLTAARKTPITYGNSTGTNRVAKPRRVPQDRYTVDSYRRAIARACEKAGLASWHPHQVRHTAATELRKQYGLDAARVVLGHRSAAITETYAEMDAEKATRVMAEVG